MSRLGRPPKELRSMVRAAEAQGWEYTPSKRGRHPKLCKPGHRPIPVPLSPSDWRGLRNFRALLRQSGITIP